MPAQSAILQLIATVTSTLRCMFAVRLVAYHASIVHTGPTVREGELQSIMLTDRKSHKVFRLVIKPVMIQVMHMFVRAQRTGQLFFKNNAVLILPHIGVSDFNHSIHPPRAGFQPSRADGPIARVINASSGLANTSNPKFFVPGYLVTIWALAWIVHCLSVFALGCINRGTTDTARLKS